MSSGAIKLPWKGEIHQNLKSHYDTFNGELTTAGCRERTVPSFVRGNVGSMGSKMDVGDIRPIGRNVAHLICLDPALFSLSMFSTAGVSRSCSLRLRCCLAEPGHMCQVCPDDKDMQVVGRDELPNPPNGLPSPVLIDLNKDRGVECLH